MLYTSETRVDQDEEIPLWNNAGPLIGEQLVNVNAATTRRVPRHIQHNSPGRTTLTEHRIETGSARPGRQQPY